METVDSQKRWLRRWRRLAFVVCIPGMCKSIVVTQMCNAGYRCGAWQRDCCLVRLIQRMRHCCFVLQSRWGLNSQTIWRLPLCRAENRAKSSEVAHSWTVKACLFQQALISFSKMERFSSDKRRQKCCHKTSTIVFKLGYWLNLNFCQDLPCKQVPLLHYMRLRTPYRPHAYWLVERVWWRNVLLRKLTQDMPERINKDEVRGAHTDTREFEFAIKQKHLHTRIQMHTKHHILSRLAVSEACRTFRKFKRLWLGNCPGFRGWARNHQERMSAKLVK